MGPTSQQAETGPTDGQESITGPDIATVHGPDPSLSGDSIQLLIRRSTRGSLEIDAIFEMLKNRRRRQVLQYLLAHGDRATVSELAEYVAAIENDKPETLLSSQERKRVYIGLYQCHLPRMSDSDVIAFDRPRGTVELQPETRALTPYLSEGAAVEPPGTDTPRRLLAVIGVASIGYLSVIAAGFVPPWLGDAVVLGAVFAVGALAIRR